MEQNAAGLPVPIEITKLLTVTGDLPKDEMNRIVQLVADTNWLLGNNFPSLREKPTLFREGDLVTALEGAPRGRIVSVSSEEIEIEYLVDYAPQGKFGVKKGNREKMNLRAAQALGVSLLQ